MILIMKLLIIHQLLKYFQVTVLVPDPYTLTEDLGELGVFVHLNVGTNLLSILEISKNQTDYVPIANGEQVIGTIFKSEPIKFGDKFNARFVEAFTDPQKLSYGRLQREQ